MSPSYCRPWTPQLLARHMYVSTNTHDSLGIFRVSESHMRVRAGPSKLDRMYLTSHLVAHECDPGLCWLPLAAGPGILVSLTRLPPGAMLLRINM